MSIKQWPCAERPREKLLKRGSAALSDAELLAIFLRTGCKGYSAVDIARTLLQDFGSLRALLNASRSNFCKHRGLGEAKYTQLQAVLEMAKRHLAEELSHTQNLCSSQSAKQYLRAQLRDLPHEVFSALLLDSQNRLISYQQLASGTINSATVHPREVIKTVLQHNAAAVIFAHNHPSGVAEPSQADRAITTTLCHTLQILDVKVLDHFVIGDAEVTSFAERGWI